MTLATIFALILVCVAAYCGVSWAMTYREMKRFQKHLGFSEAEFEFYNNSMFKLGLCGIVALGFAGAIIA